VSTTRCRLRPETFLAPSYPLGPPPPPVLTVWLSMLAAEGAGRRPARVRTRRAKASWIFSQVPSAAQAREYSYTVRQGGKSWGKARQPTPLRLRYSSALTTARTSVVRGWPPGRAGGIIGSKRAHCASVRSLGYAFCLISHFTRLHPFSNRHLVTRHSRR